MGRVASTDHRADDHRRDRLSDDELVFSGNAPCRAGLVAGVLPESRSGLAAQLAVLWCCVVARRVDAVGGDLILRTWRDGLGATWVRIRRTHHSRLGISAGGDFLRATRC